MNRTIKISSLALALGLAVVAQTQATQISGGVSFSGGLTFDGTTFGFQNVTVQQGTGDFLTTIGQTVTMPNWVANTLENGFWQVATYSFDLTSITTYQNLGGLYLLIGSGTIHGTGFQDTPGEIKWSGNDVQGTLSFSASSGAVRTPDAGSALSLMGVGMVVVGMARRKMA